MKLRELFDSLTEDQKTLLLYYLDKDEDRFVYLDVPDYEGAVIGVYLERDPTVTVILEDGAWSYGRLKNEPA